MTDLLFVLEAEATTSPLLEKADDNDAVSHSDGLAIALLSCQTAAILVDIIYSVIGQLMEDNEAATASTVASKLCRVLFSGKQVTPVMIRWTRALVWMVAEKANWHTSCMTRISNEWHDVDGHIGTIMAQRARVEDGDYEIDISEIPVAILLQCSTTNWVYGHLVQDTIQAAVYDPLSTLHDSRNVLARAVEERQEQRKERDQLKGKLKKERGQHKEERKVLKQRAKESEDKIKSLNKKVTKTEAKAKKDKNKLEAEIKRLRAGQSEMQGQWSATEAELRSLKKKDIAIKKRSRPRHSARMQRLGVSWSRKFGNC